MFRLTRFASVAGMLLAACGSAFAQQSPATLEIIELWRQSGHADSSSASFTHWQGESEVPANCATCHSGEGFRSFYGIDGSAKGEVSHPIVPGGVIDCATCHEPGVSDIGSVHFPSGLEVSPPDGTATCMTCHQGRQSGIDVASATQELPDHDVNSELRFINPHYAVAAATLYGSEVKGGYEYPGRTYSGRFAHVPSFAACADCHDPHSSQVQVETCTGCHQVAELTAIRTSGADFDGDGNISTGIHAEIAALHAQLQDTITHYAANVAGIPIAYADRFPYYFFGGAETTPANRYAGWTPALLRAAYNYQFIAKDRGAYAHNPHYAVQLLHDSITDLAQASGMNANLGERP
ncbi:MAG: cytochrome c3 family protein [Devosia sp.]